MESLGGGREGEVSGCATTGVPTCSPRIQVDSTKLLLGVTKSLFYYPRGSLISGSNLVWAVGSFKDLLKARGLRNFNPLVLALPQGGFLTPGRLLASGCKHHVGRDCVCLVHHHNFPRVRIASGT